MPTSAAARTGERVHFSWPGIRAVLTFFTLLLASSLIGMVSVKWLHAPQLLVEVLISSLDAVIVVVYGVVYRDVLSPLVRPGGLRWSSLRHIAVTAVLLASFATAYFTAIRYLGFQAPSYVEPYAKEGWPLWTVFLFVSFLPGVVEEIAFRGVIMGQLAEQLPMQEALLVQAGLFAALHLSPVIFPSHFVIGWLLGRLRVRTKSVYPGMLVHAAYNAAIVGLELLGR